MMEKIMKKPLKKEIFLTSFLIFLIFIPSGFAYLNEVSFSSGNITINIYDAHGRLLSGANVTITNSTWKYSEITSGTIILQDLQDGIYSVSVYYKDIQVNATSFSIPSQTLFNIKCTVYDWTIIVRDVSGSEIISGANVTISAISPLSSSATAWDVSGSDGHVLFSKMPSATYKVRVKYMGAIVYDSNIPFSGQVSNINASLYDLNVKCLNLVNSPVQGITVILFNPTTGAEISRLNTGSNGFSYFKNYPSGTYKIAAYYKGEFVSLQNLTIQLNSDIQQTLSVDLLSLRIKVMNFKGNKIASGINITCEAIRKGNLYDSIENSTGLLVFTTLKRDNYTIRILFGNNLLSEFTHDLKNETYQSLSINAKIFDVTIKHDIEKFLNKTQLQNMNITLKSIDVPTFSKSKIMNSSGFADFVNIPLGKYIVLSIYNRFIVGNQTISIDKDNYLAILEPFFSKIKIKVNNYHGEKLEGAIVSLIEFNSGKTISKATTNIEGEAIFSNILTIDYILEVFYKESKVGYKEIKTKIGENIESISCKVFNINIELLDSRGNEPIPNAIVKISGKTFTLEGETSYNGRITLKNIPEGLFTISSSLYSIPILEKDIRISETTTTFTYNTNAYDFSIICVDQDNMPLDKGTVTIYIDDRSFSSELNEKGEVLFKNFPPTRYNIRVIMYNLEIAFVPLVELNYDGQTILVDTRVSSLRIKLFKADNSSLINAKISLKKAGKEIASLTSDEKGEASIRLPQTQYDVLVEYQNVIVGEETVFLDHSLTLSIPCKVYLLKFIFMDLYDHPIQNVKLSILRNNEIITIAESNIMGKASFYLSEGEYTLKEEINNSTKIYELKVKENKDIKILFIKENMTNYGIALAFLFVPIVLLILGIMRRRSIKISFHGFFERR
ncbi:MAG: carboxypeptidase-like regulatory domain-containing protein, partial [Nitrososphaerota archaeon]